jgi:uncharacterized membrane-anchored protein YjiN (DUF445 family)
MATATPGTSAPSAPSGPSAPRPETRSEQARARRLAVNRRQATGLLVAAAVLYVASLALPDDETWVGYVRAMLEASMVGGLADWFAVVALFRHPLGIPIPHTAIVPERKEQFGETLGEFVQHSFLTPELILERVRAARVAERAADWMAEPDNAARLAGHAADAAVAIADVLRDDDVHRVLEDTIRERVDAIDLAPLAGRALELVTAGGRHHDLLDVLLQATDRFLDENQASLRERFGRESPWWLPDAAEDRIFERLLDGVRRALKDVVADPNHELRVDFDRRVRRFTEDLMTSPDLRARADQLKQEVLTRPQLRRWSAGLWADIKVELRAQAADPDSELRRRLGSAIQAFGARLRADPRLRDRVDEAIENGVRYVAEHFHDEIADMVSGTIARWDSAETSRRLELLLGPDLQFIRINGTVVGGLAGLLIHAATQLLT